MTIHSDSNDESGLDESDTDVGLGSSDELDSLSNKFTVFECLKKNKDQCNF